MAYSPNYSIPEQPATTRLNLLLLGMSGTGKSATLKSIVMKEDVDIHGGWKTVTDTCQEGEVKVEGRAIKVVDTPGLFNTNLKSKEKQVELFRRSINETFQRCPDGFHGLVLVLSYGRRFGQEDTQTIKILKDVLGSDWLKSHGVALVTCGDNFQFDVENTKTTFPEWCKEQRGPMGELFKECNFRCVLFDNVTKDKRITVSQRAMLISVVDEVRKSRGYATFSYYKTPTKSNDKKTEDSSSSPKPTEKPGVKHSSQKKSSLTIQNRNGNSRTSLISSPCWTSGENRNVPTQACPSGQGATEDKLAIGVTSSQTVYHNLQQESPNHPTMQAVKINGSQSLNKTILLKARQEILEICTLLHKDLNWARLNPKELEKAAEFYLSKIHRLKDNVSRFGRGEFLYMSNSLSSLEQILRSEKAVTDRNGCLVDLEKPLEEKLHDVIERLEKDLDHVLMRWERAVQSNI